MRAINKILSVGTLGGLFVASSLTLFACQKQPTDSVSPSWNESADDDDVEDEDDPTNEAIESGDKDEQCDFAADPNKDYVGKSPDACATMKFACDEGQEYFSDDCGCGCLTGMADPSVATPP